MWNHCIVCATHLGENDDVEHFPVGRTLAFDSEKGRLWVTCPRCRRWNLTPLDARWEALEELEELWASAPAKVMKESIGLARLPSGTEIVRVSPDTSEEQIAWLRWGRGERRGSVWKKVLVGSAAAGAWLPFLSVVPVITYVGVGSAGLGMLLWLLHERGLGGAPYADPHGGVETLQRHDFFNAGMSPTDDDLGWSLQLPRPKILGKKNWWEPRLDTTEWREFRGDEAVVVARRAFPMLNRRRVSKRRLTEALDLIRSAGGAGRFPGRVAEEKPRWVKFRHYPETTRLGLEIALFQEDERRLVAGELAGLEAAWRSSEEIAEALDELDSPTRWEAFRTRVLAGTPQA